MRTARAIAVLSIARRILAEPALHSPMVVAWAWFIVAVNP